MKTTLLYPTYKSIYNRFRFQKISGQDYVMVIFFILVFSLISYSTYQFLTHLDSISDLVFLPPARVIGLVLILLTFMLFLSNLAFSVSNLFKASDLDLVISSPINFTSFLFGKFFLTYLQANWMSLAFILPFVWTYGWYLDADLAYYLASFLGILIYFTIPTALALISSEIGALVFPVSRIKEIALVAVAAIIFLFYELFKAVIVTTPTIIKTEQALKLINYLSLPELSWLPINWLSEALGRLVEGEYSLITNYFFLLFTCAATLISFSFLLSALFYNRAINRIYSLKPQAFLLALKLFTLGNFFNSQIKVILEKEIKSFFRDLAQIVQLILLASLCLLFLYNISLFSNTNITNIGKSNLWHTFLILINATMGAFIAISMCTRLVFPCISNEGKAFWLLQSAPINLFTLLKLKAKIWFYPVAIIATFFIYIGTINLKISKSILMLHLLATPVIVYGLVGLAVSLGAIFAKFDWEHTQQLVAGFGSFIFMVTSLLLVTVCFSVCFLVFTLNKKTLGTNIFVYREQICTLLSLVLLVMINWLVVQYSLRVGKKALERSLS